MARASKSTVLIDISASTTVSSAVDLGEWLIAGIICPTDLTSVAFTFEAADAEDGTYRACYDASGNAISVTVAADRHVLLEPQTFAGASWLKLVAGSAEAADREITLVLHRREG